MKLYRHTKIGEPELVADFDSGVYNAQVVDWGIGYEVVDGEFMLLIVRRRDGYILSADGFPVVYIQGGKVFVCGTSSGFGVEADRHGVTWFLESEVYRLVL